MFPLHPGHGEPESVVIVALALVVVGGAAALTREGWSRVGALVGVSLGAGTGRVAIELVGFHGTATHLVGHGFELSAVALGVLAGYYALFDAPAAAPVER